MAAAVWAGDGRWDHGAEFWDPHYAAYTGSRGAVALDSAGALAKASRGGVLKAANGRQKGTAKGGAAVPRVYAAATSSSSIPSSTAAQVDAPPGWFEAPQATSSLGTGRFSGQFMPHRLCNHYTAHAWCRKEDQCTFAHGMHELHPDVQAQFASQLCPPASAMLPATNGTQLAQAPQTQAFKFNTDAAPFVSSSYIEATVADDKSHGDSNGVSASPAALEAGVVAEAEPASSLPGVARRQVPAPLTIGSETPKAAERPKILLPSPTAATSSLAPGRTVTIAMSPKAAMSPTSTAQFAMTSSLGNAAFEPQMSPSAGLRSPTASSMAPCSSPTVRNATVLGVSLGSPTCKVVTPTSAIWDRSTLMKGRNLSKKLEVGPPGLAAPTPTSAARGFGFQFPQPGYITTVPTTGMPPPPPERHHRGGKGKAVQA